MIKNIKIGSFVTHEIEKEFVGMHYDINKKVNIHNGTFRIIEMEVEKHGI